MKKPFNPNLHTPHEDFCKEELNKLAANTIRGDLRAELNDASKPDIIWEAEQVAKSHGIYLEFNRAQTGSDKDWMYMIRLANPGGGPINREQWQILDDLSEKYCKDPDGHASMRFTTRQTIQFHWVSKRGVLDIVKTMAEKGLRSLNGCGDNTRNPMCCPLSRSSAVFDGHAWARRAGDYFQLPVEPFIEIFAIDPKFVRKPEFSFSYGPGLLNRKFKIAFASVHADAQGRLYADNCCEALTNDCGVVPLIENNKIERYQIYVGGGQGERNGKPSMAALGRPIGIVTEEQILPALDAVVQVHQEWGDRQNRFWARVKYVIKKMGTDWYRDQVTAKLGFPLGRSITNYDVGARHLHHGWSQQPGVDTWAYGAFIENGRLTDNSLNGRLKTMAREIMTTYDVEIMITPNQDLLFTGIPEAQKKNFEASLAKHGYGQRHGKVYSELRRRSGACVGRDTCRLTYTDSEKFEPVLIDELENMGWGGMSESIGITGCERQCFRPATKTIGLVGSGLDRYMFKLMGDDSGRFQGQPLISADGQEMYLRSVPRDQVAVVIDALFKFYKNKAQKDESLGAFHRRIGAQSIIDHLKSDPATADLMTKPFNTTCVIDS